MNSTSSFTRRKKFHVLLIVASLFFLLVTIVGTDLGSPETSVLWYASSLHPIFYVGIFFCIAAILLSIKYRRKYLGLASISMPVFYLHSLPSILHDMLPVFDVYHVIPSVFSITETGAWDPDAINFPISHIFQANSMMILNIEAMTLARIFPTILTFTMAIFIFAIARRISKKWAPIAPMMFLALNWYMEYHMARQPFGMMIWTAFWLALFLYIDKRDHRLLIAPAVILLALIPAHPGMVIITVFSMVALTLAMLISFRDVEEWNYFSKFVPVLLIFSVLAGSIYAFVPGANEYLNSVIMDFQETVFENGAMELGLGGPAAASIGYEFVNSLRALTGALHSLLAFLGFIALYKTDSKRALLLGAWFFSIYLWLAYPLTHQGRYMERTFMYSLIPATILTVALLKHLNSKNFKTLAMTKKILRTDVDQLIRITTVVIIAALLLTIPLTKNSIDTIETPSRSAFNAGLHAEDNFDDQVYITDQHQGMFRYIESITDENRSTTRQFGTRGFTLPDQPYGYRIPDTSRTDLSPLLFTDYFNNYIEIRYGNTTAVREIEEYEKEMASKNARIYDSSGARLYLDP